MSDDNWTLVKAKPKRKPLKKLHGPISVNFETATGYPSFGHQDWNNVKFYKKSLQKSNINNHHNMMDEQKHMTKIADNDDIVKPKKVKPELSKKIARYRLDNKLTQVQLAHKINLHVNIVKSYENGSAIHNPAMTSKFYRLFQTKNI